MKNTLEKYKTYLKDQELAEGTIAVYMRYAKEIENHISGRSISKKKIISYKKKLKQRGISPATVNLAVSAVNRYLKFIGYEECVVKTEKLQKHRSFENVISVDEYYWMLENAKKGSRNKYYYILRTLAQTGIRISELRYFTVEVLKEKKIQINNKGKIREIYLPNRLLQELTEYCKKRKIEEGVIFKGNTSAPIGRAAVYRMLVRIGEEVGIEKGKVYPHSFRHLFAVTYMNQYGNLTELADILGHSNLETTRIYTLTTAEEKRKRMDQLGL